MMKNDSFKKQEGRDLFSQNYFDHSRSHQYQHQQQTQWSQMQQHQHQQHQSSKFPKKITKSSTTLFNQENSMGHQKPSSFFPHSTSYDNMSSLNNMKPLVNEFIGHSSNDFLLGGTNDNSFNDKSSCFYSNASVGSNKGMHQHHSMNQNVSANGASNSSMLNNSCANGSGAGKDMSVLHVRNLDYKISADEWKRILLENFRKHCKEVKKINKGLKVLFIFYFAINSIFSLDYQR